MVLALNSLRVTAAEDSRARAQAIRNEPRNATNYLILEGIAEDEGNWEEAKRLAEKAWDLAPGSPVAANQLAYLYLEHAGDPQKALAMAQVAKKKMSSSPNVSDTLGWAYFKNGRANEAIAQFRECIAAAPANANCHYHLGLAYLQAGNKAAAAQSLQIAVRSPGFRQAEAARTALAGIRPNN